MLSAEAHVATDRPEPVSHPALQALRPKGPSPHSPSPAHLGHGGQTPSEWQAVAGQARVDWSETEGSVSLPWGTLTLRAAPGALQLRVQAAREEHLRRLEELVAGHVERFGRRDGLHVSWQPSAPLAQRDSFAAPETPGTPVATAGGRSRHLKLLGVILAVVLVLGAHAGLGGVLVANWHFTSGPRPLSWRSCW